MPLISIIIPTYNESGKIARLVSYLYQNSHPTMTEILVIDGGSTDNTVQIARNSGAVSYISPSKGRAAQMNYGATKASGDILYFVHADSFPPTSFVQDIFSSIESGNDMGRYKTKFDSNKWFLKLNAFFTRFDWFMCYGGDQTLFITLKMFTKLGGFKEEMLIMEDYEFVKRARKVCKYKILDGRALISARKYDHNSWFKVQKANRTIVTMYKNGASQEQMVAIYKQMLTYR